MSTPIRFTSTLITVLNMNASRDFYERLLGQEVEYDFGENVSFAGGFALHERRITSYNVCYTKLLRQRLLAVQ